MTLSILYYTDNTRTTVVLLKDLHILMISLCRSGHECIALEEVLPVDEPFPISDSLSLVVTHPAGSGLTAGVETVPSVSVPAGE